MNGRHDKFDQQDESAPGSGLVWVSAAVAVMLLIAAFVYALGGSARSASAYTAIAGPADQALLSEVAGYTRDQRHDLAAATSDLKREVTTASAFDVQIGGFTFPNRASDAGVALLLADQKRVKVLGLQAQSTSLRQLRSFGPSVQAADAAVAAQVRIIRQDMGLPAVGTPQY